MGLASEPANRPIATRARRAPSPAYPRPRRRVHQAIDTVGSPPVPADGSNSSAKAHWSAVRLGRRRPPRTRRRDRTSRKEGRAGSARSRRHTDYRLDARFCALSRDSNDERRASWSTARLAGFCSNNFCTTLRYRTRAAGRLDARWRTAPRIPGRPPQPHPRF